MANVEGRTHGNAEIPRTLVNERAIYLMAKYGLSQPQISTILNHSDWVVRVVYKDAFEKGASEASNHCMANLLRRSDEGDVSAMVHFLRQKKVY